ncbi:PEP-CTERM sorting domain-containing protein [Sapientia aquatica]|uniref:PEP-CTERM sorting domain-containing protein n=1 Tax=Sapientia aquatica TaxID=1549640 RepID=A0A4R5W3R4_9BURK|nr:PEP-CTERM sorting domain-containing protein [Sapientia aquatica]TDK67369.1 PEP-CTERM sorting domain-containing protein [Sapientia aquatica]
MFKALAGLIAMLTAVAVQASTVSINFDEFTTPPVNCCYGNPTQGVPVIYPTVTITGGNSGTIMDNTGWSNMQTSGKNLFGTLDGLITLNFNQPISGLSLDVINGTNAASFTLSEYDNSHNLIDSETMFLNRYTTAGSVERFSLLDSGVFSATISGNGDFGVDTITYSDVPEPATLALLGLGLLAFAGLRRRA